MKSSLPARLLSGPLTPDGGLGDVQQLTQGRTAGVDVPLQHHNSETAKAVAKLLADPVSAAPVGSPAQPSPAPELQARKPTGHAGH